MIKLTALMLFTMLTACGQAPDGVVDDLNSTQMQEISLPGHKETTVVLFGEPAATICSYRENNAQELIAARSQAIPDAHGYSYVDISSADSGDHRLYFKESQVHSKRDAILIFCSGKDSPVGDSCNLLGISAAGCFETYGGHHTLAELDQITALINRRYPTW